MNTNFLSNNSLTAKTAKSAFAKASAGKFAQSAQSCFLYDIFFASLASKPSLQSGHGAKIAHRAIS
jgi:hypothetical protein